MDRSVSPHVKLMALWSEKKMQDVKEITNCSNRVEYCLKGAKDEGYGEGWLDIIW
jgi:hypothetical protein